MFVEDFSLAVFILEDALSVWTNLGKHLLLDALCVSSIKTGTRRIMRLDELSFVVRLERRTTEDSSSRRIMRLVPVFILETHNASNNKCLPKFVQTDNASSSIKTANSVKTTEWRRVRHVRRKSHKNSPGRTSQETKSGSAENVRKISRHSRAVLYHS